MKRIGIVGGWQSNAVGEIEGEFTPNEVEQFAETVARSVVWVIQLRGHEGELSVAESSEGKVVEVFTSPDLVPHGILGDVPAHQIPLVRVLELLPSDVRIALNPGTAPTLVLPVTGT